MRVSNALGGRSLLATVAIVAFSLFFGSGCDVGNEEMKNDATPKPDGDDGFSEPQLIVRFRRMNPHIGQMLELRVVDQNGGREVGRTILPEIESAEFDLTLSVFLQDHNYTIDIYADLSGNGKYDAPPIDHAWRVVLSSATGNDIVLFEHNTDFIDIEWPA